MLGSSAGELTKAPCVQQARCAAWVAWAEASAPLACAKKLPQMPASTSPVPAVAKRASPVGLMAGVWPGLAMMLPLTFKITVQAHASAKLCAACKRFACTCAVVQPSKRAASSGCGVRTVA